jgi:hypothetical protein
MRRMTLYGLLAAAIAAVVLLRPKDQLGLSAAIDRLEARTTALERRAAVVVRLAPGYLAVQAEGGIIVVPDDAAPVEPVTIGR